MLILIIIISIEAFDIWILEKAADASFYELTVPKQLNDLGVGSVRLQSNLFSSRIGSSYCLHWDFSMTQALTLILHSSHVTNCKEQNALQLPSCWGNKGQVFVCTSNELRSFVMFLNFNRDHVRKFQELSNSLGSLLGM